MVPLLLGFALKAFGGNAVNRVHLTHQEDAQARKQYHFQEARKCYRQKGVDFLRADKCALAHYRLAEAAFEEEDRPTPSPFSKTIQRIQKRLITSIEISSQ